MNRDRYRGDTSLAVNPVRPYQRVRSAKRMTSDLRRWRRATKRECMRNSFRRDRSAPRIISGLDAAPDRLGRNCGRRFREQRLETPFARTIDACGSRTDDDDAYLDIRARLGAAHLARSRPWLGVELRSRLPDAV